MKARSNQLVCIGHRTPTIASAGRMLIDVRTRVAQSDRNAVGQPRLHPLGMLEEAFNLCSSRKTKCRKRRHFLKWLWQIHSIANVALSSAHSRSQGVRGWEEHVVMSQCLARCCQKPKPLYKNPVSESGDVVGPRRVTTFSMFQSDAGLALDQPHPFPAVYVFRFDSKYSHDCVLQAETCVCVRLCISP